MVNGKMHYSYAVWKTSIKNKKLMDSSTKNTEHKGHKEKLTKKVYTWY